MFNTWTLTAEEETNEDIHTMSLGNAKHNSYFCGGVESFKQFVTDLRLLGEDCDKPNSLTAGYRWTEVYRWTASDSAIKSREFVTCEQGQSHTEDCAARGHPCKKCNKCNQFVKVCTTGTQQRSARFKSKRADSDSDCTDATWAIYWHYKKAASKHSKGRDRR